MALFYIYIYLSVIRWPILFSLQVITRFPQFTKYLVCKLELFRDRIALCQGTKDSFSSLFNKTHKIHRILDLLSPLDNFTIQECTEILFLFKTTEMHCETSAGEYSKVLLLQRQKGKCSLQLDLWYSYPPSQATKSQKKVNSAKKCCL